MRVLEADDRLLMVRADKGEEVTEILRRVARERKIASAAITGLGALDRVRMAYFDAVEKQYLPRDFPEVFELISFTGNLGWFEGEPFLHAHVVISDREFRCFAGHLLSARVAVTVELMLRVGERTLHRAMNPEIGVKEQKIELERPQ